MERRGPRPVRLHLARHDREVSVGGVELARKPADQARDARELARVPIPLRLGDDRRKRLAVRRRRHAITWATWATSRGSNVAAFHATGSRVWSAPLAVTDAAIFASAPALTSS